ncbi:myosin light chain 5-like [Coregonus clupeaformis]|uniref:myosin light chain 5-like n=1 Tax=Coregonus clupeaformis TaxID=59861 RepID=UPI001E1C31B1|nr:myosin light chain 5-like [Coregonus clupeaformis]
MGKNVQCASRKTKKKEWGAKRAQRASSNVFSMFEQTQIQEFKEAFTLIDQDRDGFIDKEDLKDTFASLGQYFNDTLNGQKYVDTPSKPGYCTDICLQTFQVKQMFQSSTFDPARNLDYKSLCYIITHGEGQEE